MPIEFWIGLWKGVLVLGVGLFAALAVVVTIGGAFNIRDLFRTLREEHARTREAGGDGGGNSGEEEG